jgi:hypothetical protein
VDNALDLDRTETRPVQDDLLPVELPLRDAAAALGLSVEATRKRVARGQLPARKHDGRWLITLPVDGDVQSSPGPQPVVVHDNVQDRTRYRPVQDISASIDPADHARLLERLAGLEAQLAQTQEDRDHWRRHATSALERYDRDMQEMRALLSREQSLALAAGSPTVREATTRDAPHDSGTHRDGRAGDAPLPIPESSWWQRLLARLSGSA